MFVVDFVLEWCELGSLLDWQKKQLSLPIPTIKYIFRQLVTGLHYIHSQNILHRDLKPENILLSGGLVVKIGDFGSSLIIKEGTTSGELNVFVGTPEYLPPELLQSLVTRGNCFAIDWWALGCTGFWLLNGGKVLFEAPTEYLTFKAIEAGPPLSAIKACCDVDDSLGEAIIGLLQIDPLKRLEFVRDRLNSLL